jgi:hypothetical protein
MLSLKQESIPIIQESIPIIYEDGTEYWYSVDGKLHRLDGPAIKCPTGTAVYYKHGQFHREDGNGPSFTYRGIDNWWHKNGKLHRVDGPAVMLSNGHCEWWYCGYHFANEAEWTKAKSNPLTNKYLSLDISNIE